MDINAILSKNINNITSKYIFIGEYFPIFSKTTGKYYIDEQGYMYIFAQPKYAEEFCSFIGDTEVKGRALIQTSNIGELYTTGVDGIVVIPRYDASQLASVSKAPLDSIIDVGKLGKAAIASHDTNRALLQVIQTSKKDSLQGLKDVSFYTPVIVRTRNPKNYPMLSYAQASASHKNYLLLFTSTSEFDQWKKVNRDVNWEPMEITIGKINSVRKNRALLINPLSMRLILSDNQIDAVNLRK